MFIRKKSKTTVAAISAALSIFANTSLAVAAPYGYNETDDVRSKAVKNYLSAGAVISMINTKTPTVTDKVMSAVNDGSLVLSKEITETEAVNYNTVKKANSSLESGETVVVRNGEEGVKNIIYKVKYKNGNEVSREIITEQMVKTPVDKIVEYGTKPALSQSTDASGKLNYKYVLECNATAYDMSPEENGGYGGQTATGVPLDKGVIAVDPKVIPLGSRVYIEALDGSWTYGYAVAADVGGAIKGNRVDLCYRTRSECIQFGRRKCRVYVLN